MTACLVIRRKRRFKRHAEAHALGGTTAIELIPGGVVRVETRAGDWWGASLELDADRGENLSAFKQGTLHFEIRGSDDMNFSLVSKRVISCAVIRSTISH